MSKLLEHLRALETIRAHRDRLAVRRHELERLARQNSAQTRARAYRLVSDATLALLSRGTPVTKESLAHEIAALAHDRDRFAVALAQDWVAELSQAPGQPSGHGEACAQ